jgi:hypothetical protein
VSGNLKDPHIEMFQGVQSILQSGLTGTNSVPSKRIESYDKASMFPTYSSPQRTICLQICGWGQDKSLEQVLTK